MESTMISGVTRDDNVARISLIGLRDEPGIAFKIFRVLAAKKINVDVILQSIGRENTKDITFTVAQSDMAAAQSALEDAQATIGFADMSVSDKISKVSIVGAGMTTNPGIAATMFEALYINHINIHMISTSEIKVSVLVDRADSIRAVQVIHDRFFE